MRSILQIEEMANLRYRLRHNGRAAGLVPDRANKNTTPDSNWEDDVTKQITTTMRAAIAGTAAVFALGLAGQAMAASVDGPRVAWNHAVWGKKRAFTEGVEFLGKALSERTGGQFTLKVHYGTLSKSKESLDGLKLGAYQSANFCNFYHPGKNPAFMVFSQPFLPIGEWKTRIHVTDALFHHPALVKDMDRWNAVAYASTILPQYEFMGKGEPPKGLGYWKGKIVRAGGGVGQAMEKLGATRATTTATELYTALQRGTVDAASFPFTYAHVAYKLHEISDWFTSNLSPGTAECPLVFNKDAYNALPDQYKQLLADLKPEFYEVQKNAYIKIDEKNMPMLRSKLKEVKFTDAELAEFRDVAGKVVWDEWIAKATAEGVPAQELIDFIFAEAKKVQ